VKHRARFWLLLILASACAGCANYAAVYGTGGGGSSQPSPSALPSGAATPASSPLDCNTEVTASRLIAMSIAISPSVDSTYGALNGYGDATSGQVPAVSSRIEATSADTVQFANVDSFSPTPILHSAIGFPDASVFPAVPYAFPTSGPVGSTIGSSLWSTGIISPGNSSSVCYSAAFTVAPGTYLFGDFDYYNLALVRGVLVVTASTNSHRRAAMPLQKGLSR